MKQVIQSFKTGQLSVMDVPAPQLQDEGILVQNAVSVVSAGTERMIIDFAEKNLLQKAQARPDLVQQVWDKFQREGILNTLQSVRNRLEQALPLGYSSAGTVIAAGKKASQFQIGDRVACAGGGYANHAELIYVPRTLAVKLPQNVSYEAGAFTTLGAIALQGVRLADLSLGDNVLVIGLGLLGQLTIQLAKAAGCRVMGVDLNPQRVELALQLGADAVCINADAPEVGQTFTHGRGFDAVLITADTKSDEPVTLAGELAREKGIVVAVGAVGMNLPRKIYYDKELDFRISRSYGPGRYDPEYEAKGNDYPYSYVRWTEQRNMEAFVQLVSAGKIQIEPLITHRYPIEEALTAYEVITGKTQESFLGVLLTYKEASVAKNDMIRLTPSEKGSGDLVLGMVGAGNFARNVLLPAIKSNPHITLQGIISGAGVTAKQSAQQFGFHYCASDYATLLKDEKINWLAIATRHNLHAEQVEQGLNAGKHIFVEKPLTIDAPSLMRVIKTQQSAKKWLMVGFNRRFAPLVVQLKKFLEGGTRPLIGIYRVNAGFLPANHWLQDQAIGGGRIIGEVTHFIDLLIFLFESRPMRVITQPVFAAQEPVPDEVVITLQFENGSVGTIIYSGNGDKSYGKERIEMIGDGKIATLDDFHTLELVNKGKRRVQRSWLRASKGHRELWEILATSFRNGQPQPIPLEQIIATHMTAFAAVESLQQNQPVNIEFS